jgi:streptomycin 6-kinase
VNDEFRRKVIALRGDVGEKWLRDLPQIVLQYEEKWGITCLPPFQLTYNYVAPATTNDGKDVVLKISFPRNDAFGSEIDALNFFNGSGAIQVLHDDRKHGAVLLERAEPGMRVREISPDKKQISIVSEVLKQLHKPVSEEIASLFPTISDWAKVFARYKEKFPDGSGPVPKWMFDKAESIFREFPKDKKELVLLHGDFHSDNILSSQRGWLIIDPNGLVGEREFELGAFLRNPYYDYPKGSDYKKLETSRILQFAEELHFDKERLRSWAFACAVISLLWFLEDEKRFNTIYIQNAELLNGIKF